MNHLTNSFGGPAQIVAYSRFQANQSSLSLRFCVAAISCLWSRFCQPNKPIVCQ